MKMRRQRGVAIVTALLLTTLAVTIVASLFWQQQVQVRSMENQRLQLQTRWILRGALDWTRLILTQSGIDLGGLTLPPGVYCYAGAINITGTLTLNGPGVYIFRSALTLNATANAIVALKNGATAVDVNWLPVGPTTLGANAVFKGNVLGQAAAITVGDNTTLLNGRVLSAAAVTLRNNQITK